MKARISLALVLGRIVLQRLWSHPGCWALGLALFALCPFLSRLSPLGSVPGGDPVAELTLSWALPVALLGVLLGLGALSRLEEFLRWLPASARALGEVAGLFAAALSLELPLVLGALLATPGPPPNWGFLGVAGLLAALLHLSAVGVLLLRCPTSSLLRGAILLAVVWILPALLADDGGAGRLLRPGIDPSQHLGRFSAFAEAPLPALAGLAPCAALLLAGWLLLGSRSRAPRS